MVVIKYKIVLLSGLLLVNLIQVFSQSQGYNRSNTLQNQIRVLHASDERMVIRVELDHFQQTEIDIHGETYYSILLPGEALVLEKGFPQLPKISRSIMIPGNTDFLARIVNAIYKEKPLRVIPSKGILSRTINPEDVAYVFGDIYKQDTFYPETLFDSGEPYLIRDIQGVTMNIYPFSCNPRREILRICTEVEIEITFIRKNSRLKTKPESFRANRFFSPLLENHFLNYNYLCKSADYNPLEDTGKMLVICYDDFMDEILPLVYFKNNRGLITDTVSMSVVGSSATDIMSFIQDYYDNDNSLTFVLLVGDHSQVPSMIYEEGGSDPSFSLVSGSDNYPDIIIGRFSAETGAQVETMVQRTIEYENQQEQNWFHSGMGIASLQGTGDDNEYDYEHIRNIRTQLLSFHYTDVAELYDGSQGGADAIGNPTAAMVSDKVNEGVSVINYTGHGSTTRWSTSGFAVSNVNALTNDNMLPFVFSVACLNGDFTNSTCFAEAWLRASNSSTGEPTGAVGFYGSSVNQDWSPPMEAQDEFNELLVNQDMITFGALCYSGSCSMLDKYGALDEDSGTYNFLTWVLFGDPSLSVIPTNLGYCYDKLNITDSLSSGSFIFCASDTLIARNAISDSATVKFTAGSFLSFRPGFHVSAGCKLNASIP